MPDAMRSEFEAEYPLPENATFNGDVYIAPLPAEGMTAYNVRWDAWKRAWKAARTVPEGFVMVPVEPTPEMQAAGAQSIRFDTTTINKLWTGNKVYRAMLSAAPEGK